MNVSLVYLSKFIAKFSIHFIVNTFAIAGVFVLARMTWSYALYHNGLSIPQYIAPLRVSYSIMILNSRIKTITVLKGLCENVQAECLQAEPPHVVVVIGESFSKFHCSLYGYDRTTFPLLDSIRHHESLIVYSDAVAAFDGTHGNMRSIFSTAEIADFGSRALFPSYFRKTGFRTELHDNQYFIGQGVTFLTDPALSTILWDYRNTQSYDYDGDMISNINISDSPTLYVIHLMGQHYTYSNRYPEKFRKFTPEDYDRKWTPEQRTMIAHYDNANYYNDYVMAELIKKFKDTNSILIYFSDHGEEVFELTDYMGHGGSMNSNKPEYQLAVPFMVWMSKQYIASNNHIAERIIQTADTPMITSDVAHMIMDVAGISTPDYVPARSVLNPAYNRSKHRIVMNSFDYDHYVLSIQPER